MLETRAKDVCVERGEGKGDRGQRERVKREESIFNPPKLHHSERVKYTKYQFIKMSV